MLVFPELFGPTRNVSGLIDNTPVLASDLKLRIDNDVITVDPMLLGRYCTQRIILVPLVPVGDGARFAATAAEMFDVTASALARIPADEE